MKQMVKSSHWSPPTQTLSIVCQRQFRRGPIVDGEHRARRESWGKDVAEESARDRKCQNKSSFEKASMQLSLSSRNASCSGDSIQMWDSVRATTFTYNTCQNLIS